MSSTGSDICHPCTSEEFAQTSPAESSQTSPSETPQNSPSTSPVPRINKSHGFLKHIIKNQIERDEYHKAVALTREERDHQYQRILVNQKISQNRYIPPHLRSFATPASSNSSPALLSENDLRNDPHSELRVRARRSLQREGIL